MNIHATLGLHGHHYQISSKLFLNKHAIFNTAFSSGLRPQMTTSQQLLTQGRNWFSDPHPVGPYPGWGSLNPFIPFLFFSLKQFLYVFQFHTFQIIMRSISYDCTVTFTESEKSIINKLINESVVTHNTIFINSHGTGLLFQEYCNQRFMQLLPTQYQKFLKTR